MLDRVPSLTTGESRSVVIQAPHGADFPIDGRGSHSAWNACSWSSLHCLQGDGYATAVKVRYSSNGIYILFLCEDRRLCCTIAEDYGPLYLEDVVEVFLKPDPAIPLYLEYELSPLDHELVLLIANRAGRFRGWRPMGIPPEHQIRHATHVMGGPRRSGADVTSWTAEMMIPFGVMLGFGDSVPKSGDRWQVNFNRIDHDDGHPRHWSLAPLPAANFHLHQHYGWLEFG